MYYLHIENIAIKNDIMFLVQIEKLVEFIQVVIDT